MGRVLLLLLLVIGHGFDSLWGADPTSGADPQTYAEKFNPNIFALNSDGSPTHPMLNAFSSPASDIASDVAANNWFNLLVFLPFLVAPQILLLVVIFRFRDRGDGRKPATFMTNHRLEAIWTIIPILALVVVTVPVAKVLYKMELPPAAVDTNDATQATEVKITGHQFWWEYDYKAENIIIGHDIVNNQEPFVIVKDRPAVLNLTSGDVNHAWWVPSFGVKKSCIRGRYTNCWFTPLRLGVFKGDCAELCGEGHGTMFISSVVVTPDDFEIWKITQRHRSDAGKVWELLQPSSSDTPPCDDSQLHTAVDAYFAKDHSPGRRFALRYWIDTNYQALHRCWSYPSMADDLKLHENERKAKIETLVAAVSTNDAPLARQ